MAAVTSYHNHSDLKQHTFIQLEFWRSEVGNQGTGESVFLLGALEGIHFPAFLHFWVLLAFLGLWPPPHIPLTSTSIVTSPATDADPSASLFEGHEMMVGSPGWPRIVSPSRAPSRNQICDVPFVMWGLPIHKFRGFGCGDLWGHHSVCYRVWAPRI